MADEIRPITEVAVAVMLRFDGKFLLAQRPPGKAYAGYWEFPGGKLEAGETAQQALVREIQEELGVRVTVAYPWLTHTFTYPHARVKLRFFRVLAWEGEPHPHEGQTLAWETAQDLSVTPLLPANGPILHALRLATVMGISHAGLTGEVEFLHKIELAFKSGLRLLQVREPTYSEQDLLGFAQRLRDLSEPYGVQMLLNTRPQIATQIKDAGLHLSAKRLLELQSRPDFLYCGASCHNPIELARAAELQLDYVVLGSVLATPSHPEAKGMGWDSVGDLIRDYPLPVYCIGGMRIHDLQEAWTRGAHGIAMMRGIAQCA